RQGLVGHERSGAPAPSRRLRGPGRTGTDHHPFRGAFCPIGPRHCHHAAHAARAARSHGRRARSDWRQLRRQCPADCVRGRQFHTRRVKLSRRSVMSRRFSIGVSVVILAALAAPPAFGEKHYDPGVTDTEIKLGQTAPYSGPVSAYGTFGKASLAYFAMINDKGGINGRKITLLSVDDGFSPNKTVEQVRKLVEADGVFFLYAPVGTAPNLAIKPYMNDNKI